MTFTLKRFAQNSLFTLNAFIVFLVVFENSIKVPEWLRSVGRFHPLVLHFPIVLLILTLVSAFFRSGPLRRYRFPENLSANMLLTGALASAITVITGLFLSREGGYEGATLQSHKWTGVAVAFAASIIYAYRNYIWDRPRTARVCSILAILLIIVTGHFGSTITHGDNFLLLEPTKAAVQVSFNQAVLFDHVIKPIVKNKCGNCHNPDKAKGGLDLTDSASFVKGGKTGKLFVPAKPDQSLLIKRIHLPDTDEESMPPEGERPLTQQELTLFRLWIESGASFSRKVNSLPVRDSMRQIAATLLDQQEQYNFPAADEQTVSRLNNEYRLVTTVATGSPALAVKLYNRSIYKGKLLEELEPVKMQIVSLDLNKLPVSDADLQIIGGFQNLRKLNLNFTDITGAGLKSLLTLKELKDLSLSGTKITFNDLAIVKEMKNLEQVTTWNTPLERADIEQLRAKNRTVAFIAGFNDDGMPAKLTPPQLGNNTVVFKTTLPLSIKHPVYGVSIRYTVDGTEPDSLNSPLLTGDISLDQNTRVKAKAFKPGWYSSDVAEFNFYKNAFKPDSIFFLKEPYENYRASGVYTFFDGEMGDFNFYRYNKNKWLGFKGKEMDVLMEYKTPQPVSSVSVHALVSVGDNVFPPSVIEIWGGTDKNNLKLIAKEKIKMPAQGAIREFTSVSCKFAAQDVTWLKVVATPVMVLPSWSGGKGEPSLMLVDEMLVN